MTQLPLLYTIADGAFGDPVEIAKSLVAGGARLVQIRDKHAASGLLLSRSTAIAAAAPTGVQILVNDRIDIALLAGASGAHIGQRDLPPGASRKLLGAGKILGLSTHGRDQAIAADDAPVDYVAVGPIFQTTTKTNPDAAIGLEELADICDLLSKPVVAIGGIRLDNVADVMAAGAASVAVIADLIGQGDIKARTGKFLDQLR